MNINKKGFTLVELLAVIVILGIILVIAVPNVLGIVENSRKDSFLKTAQMMASQARTKMASEPKYEPSQGSTQGTVRVILLSELNMENTGKDVDGGVYGANSYVYIAKDTSGTIRFFVTLQGSKRAINAVEEKDISSATPGASSTAEDVATVTGEDVVLGGATYDFELVP